MPLPDLSLLRDALDHREVVLEHSCPDGRPEWMNVPSARDEAEVSASPRLPAVLWWELFNALESRQRELLRWGRGCEPAPVAQTFKPVPLDLDNFARPDPNEHGESCESAALRLDKQAARLDAWGYPAAGDLYRSLATTRRAEACEPALLSPAAGCDVFGVGVPPATGGFGLPNGIGWIQARLGLWRPLGCVLNEWQDRGPLCPAGLTVAGADAVEFVVVEQFGDVSWIHLAGTLAPEAAQLQVFAAAAKDCSPGVAEALDVWTPWSDQAWAYGDGCVATAARASLPLSTWGIIVWENPWG